VVISMVNWLIQLNKILQIF